ncbi:MAG: aldo/keto reductase, partial [Spirochaetales bacterium]|nr:aldo/keto reductase [Spirochaetales bacterium]
MKMIPLKNTDLTISRLCAGAMGLGGGWQPNTELSTRDEDQARNFIRTALDLGINFFDHADIYAVTRAEAVFGRILRETPSLRDRMVLQSKCGIRWKDDPPGTPQRFDFSKEHILRSTEASLRRLNTDHLDILLLHRPDALAEGEEIAQAFETLRSSGKVRYFGVSNQNRDQVAYLQSFLSQPLVVNQVEMSLLHHGFAEAGISFNQFPARYPNGWEGLVEYCSLKGVSLQAWSPLARGVVTNTQAADPRHRATAELVTRLAADHGVAPEALALAWL